MSRAGLQIADSLSQESHTFGTECITPGEYFFFCVGGDTNVFIHRSKKKKDFLLNTTNEVPNTNCCPPRYDAV